jgi:hypothetical protein
MISRWITAADLSGVTGYSRHQLRGLLKDLPGYSGKAERARVARKYSRHDLVVIAVCCELESHYGLRRDAICRIVQEIQRALSGPKSVATDAKLVATINPPSAQYLDGRAEVSAGLVVPLQAILRRIDGYLSIDQPEEERPLDFRPVPVFEAKAVGSIQAKKGRSNISSDSQKVRRRAK